MRRRREAATTGAVLALGLLFMAFVLGSNEGVAASVTVLVLGGGVLGLLVLRASPKERAMVGAIFGTGLVLRVAAAAVVYNWKPSFFSSDQFGYYRHGAALARQWHSEGSWPSLGWVLSGPESRFIEMWAVLSYFVGPSELALRVAVGVVGAYTAVRVYALGREWAGESTGRWAGWLAACWPSLIIWSAQGLRDPLIIWLWTEVGLGVVRASSGRAWRGLAGLGLALYGLTLLRPYAAVLAAIGACLAFLATTASGAKAAKVLGMGMAGLALLVGGLGFLGSEFLAGHDLESAQSIRRSFEAGGRGSAFAVGASISTPAAAAIYLPVGMVYFLLGPFPWHAGSALQMSTMVEQPVWYILLWFTLLGLVRAVRRGGIEGLSVLGTVLPGVLFYALVMSNLGTGYRDKAQFLPVLFLYAALGWLGWRARRRRRRGPVATGSAGRREGQPVQARGC